MCNCVFVFRMQLIENKKHRDKCFPLIHNKNVCFEKVPTIKPCPNNIDSWHMVP